MPVPKKHVSTMKQKIRRAQDKLERPDHIRSCPQCAEPMQMHRVCASCGYYRGKEIIEIPLD